MRHTLLLLIVLLSLTGCRSPREFEADRQAQQRALKHQQEVERQRRLAEERQRTELLIEDTEVQMGTLRNELNQIQGSLATRASNQDVQNLEQRIRALEEQVNRLEAQRAQDKEEIVRILSQRMAQVMAQQPAAQGRTHVVAQGETLSAIAAAYGVSSRAIINANQISNPNALRIGQKLIIPGN